MSASDKLTKPFTPRQKIGLYYKHFTIVIDDCSVINKWWVSLTDDTRVVIHDRNVFKTQATEQKIFDRT